MSKAIYAFSGDPITYGHIDIIERAASMFQHVVVGIGVNPAKKYLLSLDERSQLARNVLSHLNNVTVMSFTGMLTDFAYEHNIKVIIRGLRNAEDFNFEMMLHQINENQKLNIDTVFIPTRSDMSHISSGAAKAVQLEQGNVKDYVPLIVKQKLEMKVSGQVLLGVTGCIASGKSTFCSNFEQQFGIPAHHMDMDVIGKDILFGSSTPARERIRDEIKEIIGVAKKDALDITTVREKIFARKDLVTSFNDVLRKPFEVQLRRKLYNLKGLILIESALFAEMKLADLVNNNLVLVGCTPDEQHLRLLARGYTEERIVFKNDIQLSASQKKQILVQQVFLSGYGNVFEINNENDDSPKLKEWLHDVLQQ